MTKIITIACWSITGLAITGLVLWLLYGSSFGLLRNGALSIWPIGTSWETLTGPYEPVDAYNVPVAGIDAMKINWEAGAVTINPYDGEDIRITELAQRELSEDERLQFAISDGTLTIRYHSRDIVLRRMPQKRIEIHVPHSLSENLSNLTIDTVSGSINVDGINAGSQKVNAVSGSVMLKGSNADKLDVNTTSGSITIDSFEAREMKLRSVSGSLRISNGTSDDLDCGSTSGAINIGGSFQNASLRSISGRVVLDNSALVTTVKVSSTSGGTELSGSFDNVDLSSVSGALSVSSSIIPSSLRASTTSGRVMIAIPDEGAIAINHSSTSGKLSSEVPVMMQAKDAQFRISTVSSNVDIVVITA